MSGNAALAARFQEEFRLKMDEEMTSLAEAFGAGSGRIQKMATDRVLEYMRKTYPGAFFMAHEFSLWDIMNYMDKLLWWLTYGLKRSEEDREELAEKVFLYYLNRGGMPPFWSNPNPKEVKVVELRIGLDKNAKNVDGGILCQE